MLFGILLNFIRIIIIAFVLCSFLLWRYLNVFHRIDHRSIFNAEYKHDELDSYTYFRSLASDVDCPVDPRVVPEDQNGLEGNIPPEAEMAEDDPPPPFPFVVVDQRPQPPALRSSSAPMAESTTI